MRTILIALELARIIAGEAPGCPLDARLAVAQIAHERVTQGLVTNPTDGWFGDRDPESIDVYLAFQWHSLPVVAPRANYMIAPRDKERMPWLSNNEPVVRWTCKGTALEAYYD